MIVIIITLMLTKKQKYKLKKFLNKYFKQNYNLNADEVIKLGRKKR